MKAKWSDADIQEMGIKALLFAPEDLRLIQAGLAVHKAAEKQLLTEAITREREGSARACPGAAAR